MIPVDMSYAIDNIDSLKTDFFVVFFEILIVVCIASLGVFALILYMTVRASRRITTAIDVMTIYSN